MSSLVESKDEKKTVHFIGYTYKSQRWTHQGITLDRCFKPQSISDPTHRELLTIIGQEAVQTWLNEASKVRDEKTSSLSILGKTGLAKYTDFFYTTIQPAMTESKYVFQPSVLWMLSKDAIQSFKVHQDSIDACNQLHIAFLDVAQELPRGTIFFEGQTLEGGPRHFISDALFGSLNPRPTSAYDSLTKSKTMIGCRFQVHRVISTTLNLNVALNWSQDDLGGVLIRYTIASTGIFAVPLDIWMDNKRDEEEVIIQGGTSATVTNVLALTIGDKRRLVIDVALSCLSNSCLSNSCLSNSCFSNQ